MSTTTVTTTVTNTSYGQKIMGAFSSTLFGLALFFGSFIVLFLNEGRQDMSKIAIHATEVTTEDKITEGAFVALEGNLTAQELLGDGTFIKSGAYLTLQRRAEIYAREENTTTKTEDKIGGGTKETITYSYKKAWTSNPADSASFQEQTGHYNPQLTVESETFYANDTKIGEYDLSFKRLSLPGSEKITLSKNILLPNISLFSIVNSPSIDETKIETESVTGAHIFSGFRATAEAQTGVQRDTITTGTTPPSIAKKQKKGAIVVGNSNFLFAGQGSIGAPKVGDIRISYTAIKANQEGLVFGILKKNAIRPYVDTKGNSLYRLFRSTKAEALATMHGEYTLRIRIFRLVGMVMMRIGLQMILTLLPTLLSVIPLLGNVSKGIIKFATFFVALALSIVTIIISMIIQNWIALVVVLTIVIGVGGYFWMQSKKEDDTSVKHKETETSSPNQKPLDIPLPHTVESVVQNKQGEEKTPASEKSEKDERNSPIQSK